MRCHRSLSLRRRQEPALHTRAQLPSLTLAASPVTQFAREFCGGANGNGLVMRNFAMGTRIVPPTPLRIEPGARPFAKPGSAVPFARPSSSSPFGMTLPRLPTPAAPSAAADSSLLARTRLNTSAFPGGPARISSSVARYL